MISEHTSLWLKPAALIFTSISPGLSAVMGLSTIRTSWYRALFCCSRWFCKTRASNEEGNRCVAGMTVTGSGKRPGVPGCLIRLNCTVVDPSAFPSQYLPRPYIIQSPISQLFWRTHTSSSSTSLFEFQRPLGARFQTFCPDETRRTVRLLQDQQAFSPTPPSMDLSLPSTTVRLFLPTADTCVSRS